MVHEIAVIGAGASAVSLLLSLRDEVRTACLPTVAIALWGKPETFGRGEAFGSAQREHTVNTHAGMLGLTESDPSGFARWLADQGAEEYSHATRMAMARFVQQSYARLRSSAELAIDEFRGEVVDIQPNVDGIYRIVGKAGASALARCVVLCLGAVPNRHLAHLSGLPGYRGPVGPFEQVGGAKVLIAGTGPSGLDAFRSAMIAGAREIHMFSRHGFLPTCQSPAPHYQPRHFTWPHLQEQLRGRSIPLCRVLELLREELRAMESRCEYQPAIAALKHQGTEAFLRYLLHRAKAQDLPLQDVLMTTRPYMHRLWRALPPVDQWQFVRDWRALWSAWRHPVPAGIFEQLHEAVRAGIVHIHRACLPPAHEDGAFSICTVDGRSVHGSVLVDATGWNACADSMPLLRALRRRGLIERHPCGGVHVDPMRMQCIVESRLVGGLFAIGPIASGALFSTNAHWFNAKCAAQWARQWATLAGEASRLALEAHEH